MPVLTVGSGQQFATLSAALAASQDGDTIYVAAGVYLNDFAIIKTKVDIIGVGGMAHFVHDGSVPIPNGKGIFVTNTDVSFDHIEFSGAKVSDGNGAGIRYQGGNLTLTNCYFHNNQDGILAAASPTGVITIDRSEFGFNGTGDGLTHNLYADKIGTLTITNSYFHDAVVGHEIKSRAANTTVMNSRIFDLNGTSSYSIDLPNGGKAVIQNNIIQQGPNSENSAIISYAAREAFAGSSLSVTNNTIINHLNKLSSKGVLNFSTIPVQITGNDFYGLTASQIANGPSVQSGNDLLQSSPAISTTHPWSSSPWDKLVSGRSTNDVLVGSTARDLLVGGGGSDTFEVKAQAGSDTIADFGTGDVVKLTGYVFSTFTSVKQAMTASGSDTILNLGGGQTLKFLGLTPSSFAADDFGFGSVSNPDVVAGVLPESGASTNFIIGASNNNSLVGTSANDSIDGRAGVDIMNGGIGDDIYVVNTTPDVVIESANGGIDTIKASCRSYTLAANVENLFLFTNKAHIATGNGLNNLIKSSIGNDTVDGGAGNDILIAQTGAYRLTGGVGSDTITFTAMGARSLVTDFDVGEDVLDLRPLMSKAGYDGTNPLADGAIALSVDPSGGALVSVDPTNSGALFKLVTLVGVAPNELGIGTDLLWQ